MSNARVFLPPNSIPATATTVAVFFGGVAFATVCMATKTWLLGDQRGTSFEYCLCWVFVVSLLAHCRSSAALSSLLLNLVL